MSCSDNASNSICKLWFFREIIIGGYLHMFLNRSAQLMSRKRGVSLISCTLLTLCTYESVACRFGSPFWVVTAKLTAMPLYSSEQRRTPSNKKEAREQCRSALSACRKWPDWDVWRTSSSPYQFLLFIILVRHSYQQQRKWQLRQVPLLKSFQLLLVHFESPKLLHQTQIYLQVALFSLALLC